MQQAVPLEFLAAGEKGRIFEIGGRQEMIVRLEEMGLRQGVPVRMVQPGRPCIVAVNNHRMSFRGEETAIVLVQPTA